MSKPRRKSRRKKADITVNRKEGVSLVTKLEKPVVKILEPIVEEPEVTVKQPFSTPMSIYAKTLSSEEIDKIRVVELDASAFNGIPEEVFTTAKMFDAVNELPEPLMSPTQRQYGEDFLPLYIKSRNKLRRLAGLS